MLKNYKILTVTHKKTNTEDIADFIVPTDDKAELASRLAAIKASCGLEELMYLATCNRVLFLFSGKIQLDSPFIRFFFQSVNPKLAQGSVDYISENVQSFEGSKAIHHLYEIAASVDSMVVGEREIFRQLREAYEECRSYGLLGDNIRIAMQATVEVAKEVYAKTRIGEKSVSVVSLAFRKLQETEVPASARFLIVGAGKTNRLFSKFMLQHKYQNVVVFNRSIGNAELIADRLGAEARMLSELENYEGDFDVMVVCTASVEPIITQELYEKLTRKVAKKRIVIDLSLPNNISGEVVENFDFQYIDIEKLRQLAKENMAFRMGEVKKARQLIVKRVEGFKMRFRQRQIERAMSDVPTQIKAIKSHALEQVFKNELDKLDPEARELLDRMMDYMEKRCIGIPMMAVKDAYRKLHQGSKPKTQIPKSKSQK